MSDEAAVAWLDTDAGIQWTIYAHRPPGGGEGIFATLKRDGSFSTCWQHVGPTDPRFDPSGRPPLSDPIWAGWSL